MDPFSAVTRQIIANEAAPAPFVPFNASSPAHVAAFRAKAGAAQLWGFTVYNSNAGAQFILVFDLGAIPTGNPVANVVFKVAGAAHLSVAYFPARRMDEGIVLCNSSTEPTLTAGAADCSWDVQYV